MSKRSQLAPAPAPQDSTSFSRILSELDEEERSAPAVRETLAYANALYSGYADGYSAS